MTFLCLGSPFPASATLRVGVRARYLHRLVPPAGLGLGGECPTTSSAQSRDPHEARPHKRRAPGVVCPSDDDELAEYAKHVVDSLPPLTEGQRDLLALIFRSDRRKRP